LQTLSIENKIEVMRALITDYIRSKELSWSSSTLRTEKYRLIGLLTHLTGDPNLLWEELEHRGMNPYSRKTTFIRVCKFWDWAIGENRIDGPNPYRKWMTTNGRLFKHVYKKSLPVISFAEAKQRIESLKNEAIKKQALCLLENGLRVGEHDTYKDGEVVGKGNKPRKIFGEQQPEGWISYFKLYFALKEIGLKPHDLRKIRATDLAQKGLSEADLCYIFGWESFETAGSYLGHKKDLTLEEIFRRK
jgi:integrase